MRTLFKKKICTWTFLFLSIYHLINFKVSMNYWLRKKIIWENSITASFLLFFSISSVVKWLTCLRFRLGGGVPIRDWYRYPHCPEIMSRLVAVYTEFLSRLAPLSWLLTLTCNDNIMQGSAPTKWDSFVFIILLLSKAKKKQKSLYISFHHPLPYLFFLKRIWLQSNTQFYSNIIWA